MKSQVSLLALVVACAAAAGGTAQAATTLEDALKAAYANNPTLAAQRADLRSTDEQVNQAVSGWRPSVTMSADYGRSAVKAYGEAAGSDPSQHRKPTQATLSVEQPLFTGFRTQNATQRAKDQVQAARARLANSEQTVLSNAVQAFMNVVRDQATLQLNVNNEQVLKRQLDAARDRFQVGEITRTDVAQAESRWQQAIATRIQAEGNLEASRATYVNVVGEAPVDLVAPSPAVILPDDLAQATKIAVTANPSVVASEYDEKASRDNVKLIEGELLPTVSAQASLFRGLDQSIEHSAQNSALIRLVLSVPIYQQGTVYSRTRAAKELVAESRNLIDVARRNATESATRAWESLQTTKAQIVSLQSQIQAAQVALEGVQREAEVGSRTVLDVLNAEQELLNARVSLVQAQRDNIVAVYSVLTAVGQMTARHLNLPVDYYDPEQHYNDVKDKWWGLGGNID